MDIFERIRQIVTPSNIKPQTPLNSNTQKGLETVSQIRSSLKLPAKTSVSPIPEFNLAKYSQFPKPTALDTSRFEPRIPTLAQPQPQISRLPQVRAQEVMSVKPAAPKAVPFQTFTPRVPEAETPFGRFVVGKGVLPFNEGIKRIESAWNNTDNKGGLERTLEGVSGVGLIASIPNEVFIQPIWDSVKLGIKGLRTGEVTQDDINRFLFISGGEKGTIFEAFGTNEDEFGKNYGQTALAVARFADFAPELINIPGTQATKVSKVSKLTKGGKLPSKAARDADKAKQVDNAIQNFEQSTGQTLDNATKTEIKKTVNNPKPFLNSLKITGKDADFATKADQRLTGAAGQADFGGAVPPSGGIPTFLPEQGKVLPTKTRKFPATVEKAEGTAKEVKNILKDRIDLYSPIKNKDEFARATKFVDETPVDEVVDYIKFADDQREVSYIGQALMQKLQKEGNFARVIDVLDVVSEQATRSGQAIQALSVWGRLTPEGALRTANNLVRKYNQDNKLIEGMSGFIKLSNDKIKKITEQAGKISKITDDYTRLKEISKLQNEIASAVPASLGTKIATIQTLAQLLNPKTFIRNILGNAIFGSIDSLTQTFATPLDIAVSLFTKKRTIAPASLQRQFTGGVEGLKKGIQEALEGADTSTLKSQFDLPNGSVFDSKVMQGLEKALNVSLRGPDRAFYEATYKDTLEGLLKLNKVDKPTKEMLEIAHYEAMRRTFQDENRISKLFTSAKRALNYIGTKDRSFGLGDIILKYPKTPANLLVRALEYSPVGYVKAVMELARPLFKTGPFDQRAFVNNVTRATVGSGMINLGYSLASLGIITPRPDSDKDARNAQDLQGLKSYSINASALKRYVASGFDKDAAKPRIGDQLVSYDWAQPASLPLAIGANLAENNSKIKEGTFSERVMLSFGPLAGEIIKSSDTLTEQSLLQGIQKLFGYGGLQQGLTENILSIPQSFVPTILNQVNQYTDNASRETYSPDLFQASFNQFAARVPFLAQTLPQRVDVLGKTKERFPNSQNTFFNVFFNPAFVDQIKNDPSLTEVISLYEETGEKGQFPRVVDKTITIGGQKRLLNADEIISYQREVGTLSDTLIKQATQNPEYIKLPTQEKALFLANVLSDVNKIAKVRLFGDNPNDLSGRLDILLNNDTENYLVETLKNKQEQLRKEALKAQGLSFKKVKLPSLKKAKGRKITTPKPKKLKFAKVKIPKIKKPKKQKSIKLKANI